MCNCMPLFSSIIRPLAGFLGRDYQHTGKRTWLSIASANLSNICWSQLKEDAFDDCEQASEHQETLGIVMSSNDCVFTLMPPTFFGLVSSLRSLIQNKQTTCWLTTLTFRISIRSLYWPSTAVVIVGKRNLSNYGNHQTHAMDTCNTR